MRRPVLFLLPALLSLAACAPINGAPNGWAVPVIAASPDVVRAPSEPKGLPVTIVEAPPAALDLPTPSASTASGLLIPVDGIAPGDLRDTFRNPRSGGRRHNAIDIGAPTGTPLRAVTDGVVTRKHWHRRGGRTLYLRSADGRYDFYYAHLDTYADDIEIGTEVKRGDLLGTVGATGNARGAHLHFQVLDQRGSGRGTPVNPYDLLQAADVASAD